MQYTNPIIPGFHPDPSICRAGEDYYLVTSSFEYFPAIPLFHSKNLIDWEQIGYGITNSEWLPLMHGVPNCSGIYAPTIRYHNGRFYIICTNVSTDQTEEAGFGNFIISAEDPRKEWKKPVFVDCPGIDPSLFFDENGKTYYSGSHNGIYLCEINADTGERLSGLKYIWPGTGGCCPEGPHLYQKDGWYYLMIAEGGTEYGHMVTMARSKYIEGPYESCPHNPVLSNRSKGLPIMAVGHADLIEDTNKNWWAVCLCNRPIGYPPKHNLGRETSLVPVSWAEDQWPKMGNQGIVEEHVTAERPELSPAGTDFGGKNRMPKADEAYAYTEDFTAGAISHKWNYRYNPTAGSVLCEKDTGVRLRCLAAGLSDADTSSFLGCRQQHHACSVRTDMCFWPTDEGQEAGIAIYLNRNHHYEAAIIKKEQKTYLIFRRQIGSLWKVEQQIPYDRSFVCFKIEASKETYQFFYSTDQKEFHFLGSGESAYLTTETGGGFTGNYFALYATGNGREGSACAEISRFCYSCKG